MKSWDPDLRRLLNAAARAKRAEQEVTEMPSFVLETRLLAAWSREPLEDNLIGFLLVFRRAMTLACAIMLCALTLHFLGWPPIDADPRVIAEKSLQLSLLP